ncbi:MAG: peroxiredoxin family protein [Desulfurococcales archaeon]|nr:peroxiredoxin family protein [Desulfurococcales archaeon]
MPAEEGPNVGNLAPDFTLQSIDGRTFKLSDFRGKNVVVWFMIPVGCPICASQVEELKKLQQELGEDLVVIAVTLLNYDGVADDLAKFRDEKGLKEWFYAVDTEQLGIKYNIVEMGVVIVGPDGTILHRGIPQASFDEMLSAIKGSA